MGDQRSQPSAGRRSDQRIFESGESSGLGRTRSDRDASLCNRTQSVGFHNGRNHGDGNYQITPGAKLQKGRGSVVEPARNNYAAEDFIGAAQSLSIAHDEVRKRNTA